MKGWKHILLIFRSFMVLAYLVLGALMLFTNVLPLPISTTGKTIFGIVLVLYGSFRIYTYITEFKAKNDEE